MRALLPLLLTTSAAAAEPRRDMSTDRPDKTESPFTIDRGLFQIEADLVAHTRDREGPISSRGTAIGTVNLKYGLDHSTDLQFVVSPYLHQRVRDRLTGSVMRASGIGDVTIRLKRNIWGNDGGATALAIMPYVSLPTSSNGLGADHVEGGVIVPLAVSLAQGVGLGLMAELDIIRDPRDGNGYVASFVNSATVSFDLTDRLGVYGEIFTEKAAHVDWVATFDAGLTFAVTDNLQLDGGANIGLNREADDLTLFLGVSHRF